MLFTRRKFIAYGLMGSAHLLWLRGVVKANSVSRLFQLTRSVLPDDIAEGGPSLLKEFLDPPDKFKSSCYWWWFNGLVDKQGITRDLEAYRKQGMGAVLMVNSAGGLGGVPFPQGAKFLSEEWKALYRHAMQEAGRLKIDVGVNMCSGWCMGGPWITPENAGRWYLQSELRVKGPGRFNGKLPLPAGRSGYDNVFNPPGYKDYIDLPLSSLDYRDTAVVAFKDHGDQGKIKGERGKVLDAKTNHRDASNFAKAAEIMDPTRQPWLPAADDKPAAVSEVIDLSSRLKADGSLDWEIPEGNWIILRTGHRMTGSRLMIAQPEADGLSVDWFDRRGVELQFENIGQVLITEAAKVGNKPQYFCDDSFEDGFPNWTADIINKFKHYRGYDPTRYLPALSGYIIGSAGITDRFLTDYRKTIADLMADEHYGRFRELCHKSGLLVQNESAGPSRSGTICLDGLKNLGRSDFPMGEFWLGPHHDDPSTLTDDKNYGVSRLDYGQNKVTKMVASAAHIYGKKTASAEAFTSFRHWMDAPGNLKQALDRAYAEGINRIAIHTSTATRPKDGKPGYEYGAGTHFNPNVTWWDLSSAFFKYVARCQRILQAGLFVADVLYYNGDAAPNLVLQKHINPSLGPGYDYDVCNEEVLIDRLSVSEGKFLLPDGMHYEVLVLPENNSRMPLTVLEKIAQLVKQGGTVIGSRPLADSGLYGYPECDQKLTSLADTLWKGISEHAGEHRQTRNKYGKGQVVFGESVREVLLSQGVLPDFTYEAVDPGKDIWLDFIHRRVPEAEMYFVTNRKKSTAFARCRFRLPAGHPKSSRKEKENQLSVLPELWDAVRGTRITGIQFKLEQSHIVLDLCLDAFQSVFVVLHERQPAADYLKTERAPAATTSAPKLWQAPAQKLFKQVLELNEKWEVAFDPEWGGPEKTEFARLQDWSQHMDPKIKYYSGKAWYKKRFDMPVALKKEPGDTDVRKLFFIDLGSVKDIATVKLNGVDLGIVWTAPWRVDISSAVKAKDNILEVEVINQWPNRLIGDAALPKAKRRTSTNIEFKPSDPLLPSGLLGPVTVLQC